MADIKYPRDSFVVYKTAVDAMNELKGRPELQGQFAISILQFGAYHDYDFKDDPVINGLMRQQQFNIDTAAQRYENAKENGKKGGRKEKYSAEAIYQYYKVEGHSLKETVDHFGCAERTVQDKCKKYLAEKSNQNTQVNEVSEEPQPQEIKEWRF